MSSRYSKLLIMLLVLVLVAVACTADEEEPTEPAAAAVPATEEPEVEEPEEPTAEPEPEFAGTIVLGAAVSDTGKYAREGQDTRQGYDLWLDWINNE